MEQVRPAWRSCMHSFCLKPVGPIYFNGQYVNNPRVLNVVSHLDAILTTAMESAKKLYIVENQ